MPEFYVKSNKYNIQERKTKKHGKVYDVVFRVTLPDGERKQKRLSGYHTRTLAKRGYLEFVENNCEMVKEVPQGDDRAEVNDELLVKNLIEEYVSTLFNQNKESTIYAKKFMCRQYVLPTFANTLVTDIDRQALYRWQDSIWKMKNPRTGDYYAHKYLCVIRGHFSSFLSWCESRYDAKNHFGEVKKPKNRAPKRRMQIWTKEQFDKFISVVDEPMYHALFTLMFYTGRRKGELFALSPADVKEDKIVFGKSLSRKSVTGEKYVITSTKADKVQEIPICGTVRKELERYRAGSPFFFGGEKPLVENTVARAFKNYCRQAALPVIRIHDLRHSFVSMLIHLGANFTVVADLIGDTVKQVTETYGHMYEDDKKAIISLI